MSIHLYLSPHFDDAILSCGGLIHRQRMSDETVSVINLCAGTPESSHLPPLAQQYHAAWGNLRDPVASRRAEDEAVLSGLGVEAHNLSTPDSIYRHADGRIAYADVAALFREPHLRERDVLPDLWQRELEPLYPRTADVIIYAPLAAGNHVDHQLGRALGARLINDGWTVWFYEDFPHVESPGALQTAQAHFGIVSWQAQAVRIDADAKIAAIRGYQTQWPSVFGDDHVMVRRVKRFTAETACDISLLERIRHRLAGVDGQRERIWRAVWGYHAHAERIWRPVQ